MSTKQNLNVLCQGFVVPSLGVPQLNLLHGLLQMQERSCNHQRMLWVGRDLEEGLVPATCHGAGMLLCVPDYSVPVSFAEFTRKS